MKTKILLLSVGSLLGKVMLDILASRRDKLWLIGANSEAETPHLFHCDQAHLLPSITHPDYPMAFEHLLTQRTPDIILPGRDDDVVFLAQFRAQHPEWAHAIPCGQADIARIIHDKYTCFQLAQTQGLPFAHSFLYTHPPHETLETFLAQVSFPLLAKPRQGFGSQGILFIENREHLERLGSTQELLLQEYLEPPETLTPYFEQYHQGMPLFFKSLKPASSQLRVLFILTELWVRCAVPKAHWLWGKPHGLNTLKTQPCISCLWTMPPHCGKRDGVVWSTFKPNPTPIRASGKPLS